jgi:fluoroquinolone transport system permease protein
MKYGLYTAGAVLTLVWVGILSLFSGEAIRLAVPIVLLSDISTMGLLFIGSIIFFERGQGSIAAVITTPLKTKEYIVSKIVSLTLFITMYSLLLTLLTSWFKGQTLNMLMLFIASVLIAVEYTLIGFYLSTFFKKFTDFLLPMGLVFAIMNLPIFTMFNIPALEAFDKLFYIIPSTGFVKLLLGLYTPLSGLDVMYALLYNGIVIVVLFKLCIKNFNTKIIGRSADLDD